VHLVALDPRANESPRPAQIAYAQFNKRQLEREKGFSMRNIFSARMRPMWISLGVIILLAVAFSFPPVQAWAGDMLARFRVSQVVVLPVDTTRMSELGGNTALTKQISQLFSDSVKVTREAGKPQSVANVAAATKAAGFAVRLPSTRTDAPQLTVQGGLAFQFTVNRARAQSLLDEAGFKQYKLPTSLDGALIKVDVPSGVTAAYGDCPLVEPTKDAPARRSANCVFFAQMPSPVVDTPPNLDVSQLAIIGLQFGGMSEQQARDYSKTVDWTSTLVIPVPRNGSTHKQVQVDGVNGYLIQQTDTVYTLQYALIWVKNGVVYAISGIGTDTNAALAMGNSLR